MVWSVSSHTSEELETNNCDRGDLQRKRGRRLFVWRVNQGTAAVPPFVSLFVPRHAVIRIAVFGPPPVVSPAGGRRQFGGGGVPQILVGQLRLGDFLALQIIQIFKRTILANDSNFKITFIRSERCLTRCWEMPIQ